MNDELQQKRAEVIQKCNAVIQSHDFDVESCSDRYYSVTKNGIKFSIGSHASDPQDCYVHVPGVDGLVINSKDLESQDSATMYNMWVACDKRWQAQHKQRAIDALMHLEKFVKTGYTVKELQTWDVNKLETQIILTCLNIVNSGRFKPQETSVHYYCIGDVFEIKNHFNECTLEVKDCSLKNISVNQENAARIAQLYMLCDEKWKDLEQQRCDKALELLTQKKSTVAKQKQHDALGVFGCVQRLLNRRNGAEKEMRK